MPFDRRTSSDITIEDIDIARFELEYVTSATSPEIRAENGRSTLEKMRALRLANAEGQPTVGAVLLFGIDPRSSFTGAYVQFLRVQGTDLDSGIVSHREISGTIPHQLRQVEELIALNLATSATIGENGRTDSSPYPLSGLQQLVRTSKTAAVLALLGRSTGATLPELIEATGWLPHTTRAALTGLRKKGHVDRSKRDDATCYRLVSGA